MVDIFVFLNCLVLHYAHDKRSWLFKCYVDSKLAEMSIHFSFLNNIYKHDLPWQINYMSWIYGIVLLDHACHRIKLSRFIKVNGVIFYK